jgi:hypothetical protein
VRRKVKKMSQAGPPPWSPPITKWPPAAKTSDLAPPFVPMRVYRERIARLAPSGATRDIWGPNPCRIPGTGFLPGQLTQARGRCGCGCAGPCRCGGVRPTHDQALEAWRAWQRRIGRTDPPIRPIPGLRPPNFFGPYTYRC